MKRWWIVPALGASLLVFAAGRGGPQAVAFPRDPGLLHKVGVVLSPGPIRAWDDQMVESPSVVRDPAGGWAMLYVGYGGDPIRPGIGLARSADAVHWVKSSAPALTASSVPGAADEAGATGPVVYRQGSRWVLFYIGVTGSGYEQGRKTIDAATSQTLSGPWTRLGAVVEPDGSGWDAEAVWHVSVVRDHGRWVMFFNATGSDDKERIGYATADRLLGTWRVADEPVLEPVDGTWESLIVGDPSVRRVGDHWVMDYYGVDGQHAADAEAVTTDAEFPLGWQRTGVVLAPSEAYDSQFAHKPFVVTDRGRLLHFYTAVGDDGRRTIALAVG
jgi:predicted GH43/DUF377 family glycosyl hydrolase